MGGHGGHGHAHGGHAHPRGGHAARRGHGAPAGGSAGRRRLALTLGLTLAYMVAELVGGWMTHSLALLADAGHMLSDAAALGLSMFASWIAGRPAGGRQTFGYYRAEILAALGNGALLIAISLLIGVEAVKRLASPHEVQGAGLVAVALGGLVMNVVCLQVLAPAREGNLNMRGAWLHVLSDALGSVGAIVAGVLVLAFGWTWADPVASLLIGVLVVGSSYALLKESMAVLMEGAPGHIDVDEVRDAMAAVPGVVAVHDLHVWTITSGLESLSGHVIAAPGTSRDELLVALRELLHARFGLSHVTLQMEPGDCGTLETHGHG